MRSFDTIARIYEPLERITLANTLQRARCFCLPHLLEQKQGLLIGDGDGRFSERLLEKLPEIQIDSIDISAEMLALAKRRAGRNADRLNSIHEDALIFEYPENRYDFIGLHFCLDCFSQVEVDALLPRLTASLRPGGLIAYSDFQVTRPWHAAIVRTLYFCFRQVAALQVDRLPKVRWTAPMTTIARNEFSGGLVFSELLQKPSTEVGAENR